MKDFLFLCMVTTLNIQHHQWRKFSLPCRAGQHQGPQHSFECTKQARPRPEIFRFSKIKLQMGFLIFNFILLKNLHKRNKKIWFFILCLFADNLQLTCFSIFNFKLALLLLSWYWNWFKKMQNKGHLVKRRQTLNPSSEISSRHQELRDLKEFHLREAWEV